MVINASNYRFLDVNLLQKSYDLVTRASKTAVKSNLNFRQEIQSLQDSVVISFQL